MATNSNFNLSKPVKRIAGTILNKEQRRIYLKSMIDAENSQLTAKSRKWSDPAASQKSTRPVPAE